MWLVWGKYFSVLRWQCYHVQSKLRRNDLKNLNDHESAYLNPIQHLWDELEHQLWDRPNQI